MGRSDGFLGGGKGEVFVEATTEAVREKDLKFVCKYCGYTGKQNTNVCPNCGGTT